jgi:tRNA(Ile)-lysidine synthase
MITLLPEETLATSAPPRFDGASLARFRRDLDALLGADVRFGMGVSGGPDSLALLLLAAAARPGMIEAATVDHSLRPESRAEAEMVAALCERLGLPHSILTVEWRQKPQTGIQQRARAARYRLLGQWAQEKGLRALLTAHHLDDQAETFLMRVARGAGVKGLAGMRRVSQVPGGTMALVRPLLGWRHAELEQVCATAGVDPASDPSNEDEQFERVRVRNALNQADWLSAEALALSAANLADADVALHWATTRAWDQTVTDREGSISFRPEGIPRELRRRIVRRAVLKLAREGQGADLRGRELDRLLQVLANGGKATLRGVLCTGGADWRFVPAPNRTRPVDNLR